MWGYGHFRVCKLSATFLLILALTPKPWTLNLIHPCPNYPRTRPLRSSFARGRKGSALLPVIRCKAFGTIYIYIYTHVSSFNFNYIHMVLTTHIYIFTVLSVLSIYIYRYARPDVWFSQPALRFTSFLHSPKGPCTHIVQTLALKYFLYCTGGPKNIPFEYMDP